MWRTVSLKKEVTLTRKERNHESVLSEDHQQRGNHRSGDRPIGNPSKEGRSPPLPFPVTPQTSSSQEPQTQREGDESLREQSEVNPFQTIMIDPPWPERGGGKIKRGADKHYDTMKVREILPVILTCPHWQQRAVHSHLYLWATSNYLRDALWLMDALNYTYKTHFVWVKRKDNKIQKGLGQYFRGSHELCLLGTQGKKPTAPRTENKTLSSVLEAVRTPKHSQKPASSYWLIEQRSFGPYLELFGREERKGWTVWGNEV